MERLGRRGKYLVWELADDVFLVMHLRMTGNLLLGGPHAYERVVLHLSGGEPVRFCDPRRFGTASWRSAARGSTRFFAPRLGIEPLGGELTGERLRALARGRRAPVKAFLLDQRHIAGVGNIYADEALFRARVHPLRPAGSLTAAQCEALAEAVRDSLVAGLAAGGATIDDFRHADGLMGSFQDEFLVHRARASRAGLRRADPQARGGRARDLRLRALPGQAASASSARRRPPRSAWTSSMKPPTTSSPTTICGKLSMPVRRASSARPSGSRSRLTSSYSYPRASSRALARTQNEQWSVE